MKFQTTNHLVPITWPLFLENQEKLLELGVR